MKEKVGQDQIGHNRRLSRSNSLAYDESLSWGHPVPDIRCQERNQGKNFGGQVVLFGCEYSLARGSYLPQIRLSDIVYKLLHRGRSPGGPAQRPATRPISRERYDYCGHHTMYTTAQTYQLQSGREAVHGQKQSR